MSNAQVAFFHVSCLVSSHSTAPIFRERLTGTSLHLLFLVGLGLLCIVIPILLLSMNDNDRSCTFCCECWCYQCYVSWSREWNSQDEKCMKLLLLSQQTSGTRTVLEDAIPVLGEITLPTETFPSLSISRYCSAFGSMTVGRNSSGQPMAKTPKFGEAITRRFNSETQNVS